MVFAGYSGVLQHLQLASHDLSLILQKGDGKPTLFQNQCQMGLNSAFFQSSLYKCSQQTNTRDCIVGNRHILQYMWDLMSKINILRSWDKMYMFIHTSGSTPKRFTKFGWQTRTFWHKEGRKSGVTNSSVTDYRWGLGANCSGPWSQLHQRDSGSNLGSRLNLIICNNTCYCCRQSSWALSLSLSLIHVGATGPWRGITSLSVDRHVYSLSDPSLADRLPSILKTHFQEKSLFPCWLFSSHLSVGLEMRLRTSS